MTTKLALGWDAKLAYVVPPYNGKLVMMSGSTPGIIWDDRSGYPGWGRTQYSVTASETLCLYALSFLTGKTSGMDILICRPNTESSDFFGTFFQEWVARSGTLSRTYGTAPSYGPWNSSAGLEGTCTAYQPSDLSWTNTNWGGYNPFNYDCACLNQGYYASGNAAVRAAVDYYLHHGGSVWTYQVWGGTDHWSSYGLKEPSPTRQVTYANEGGLPTPPPFYTSPALNISQFDPVQTFQLVVYSAGAVDVGVSTQGGYPVLPAEWCAIWTQL